MRTIFIISDAGAQRHAQEMEELIKAVGCTDEIKHLAYLETYPKSLGKHDLMFLVCPSTPSNEPPMVLSYPDNKTIPVGYLDSKKDNLPASFQAVPGAITGVVTGVFISGQRCWPSSFPANLSKMLGLPNTLSPDYTQLIARDRLLSQAPKSTFLRILSELTTAQKASGVSALECVRGIRKITTDTAQKLAGFLVSRSESEQQQIANFLKGTLLGQELEVMQENVPTATPSFRH